MPDNRHVPPRSTLEVLETVPDSVLRRLKQYSGRLATEAVHALEERLPFFADLDASQRASVHLVVQTAIVNFVEWMRDPNSNVSYTAQAFEVVPQDLRRRIALRHTVEMVRVTMEFFEEVVPLLARNEEQLTALTAGSCATAGTWRSPPPPRTPTPPRRAARGIAEWRPTSSTPWSVATPAPNCNPRPRR